MKFGIFSNRTSGVRKTDFIIILWVSSKAIFGAQNNVAVVLRAFYGFSDDCIIICHMSSPFFSIPDGGLVLRL